MICRVILVAATLILASTVRAGAHGTGAIHLASKQIAVGGDLVMKGEKLGANQELKLELRGILDNYPVGLVHTDAKETFAARLPVPAHAPPGAYSLVAIASDGDVSARTDLVVVAPTESAAGTGSMGSMGGMPGMPGMAGRGMQEMSGAHATAEMMKLDQVTTRGEWMIIALFILLSAGAGALLLARSLH